MSRVLFLLVTVALAACASPAASPVTTPTSTPAPSNEVTVSEVPRASPGSEQHAEATLTVIPAAIADGPGIGVPEVIASVPSNEQLVNGWLLIGSDGVVWLCEALADGTPPTCSGDRLRVEGYPSQLGGDLREAADVRWYSQPIQILGDITVP